MPTLRAAIHPPPPPHKPPAQPPTPRLRGPAPAAHAGCVLQRPEGDGVRLGHSQLLGNQQRLGVHVEVQQRGGCLLGTGNTFQVFLQYRADLMGVHCGHRQALQAQSAQHSERRGNSMADAGGGGCPQQRSQARTASSGSKQMSTTRFRNALDSLLPVPLRLAVKNTRQLSAIPAKGSPGWPRRRTWSSPFSNSDSSAGPPHSQQQKKAAVVRHTLSATPKAHTALSLSHTYHLPLAGSSGAQAPLGAHCCSCPPGPIHRPGWPAETPPPQTQTRRSLQRRRLPPGGPQACSPGGGGAWARLNPCSPRQRLSGPVATPPSAWRRGWPTGTPHPPRWRAHRYH
jgi:hypothetical protein